MLDAKQLSVVAEMVAVLDANNVSPADRYKMACHMLGMMLIADNMGIATELVRDNNDGDTSEKAILECAIDCFMETDPEDSTVMEDISTAITDFYCDKLDDSEFENCKEED